MSQFLERLFLGWRYGLQASFGTVQERYDAPSSWATVRCGTEKFFFGLEAGFEYSYVFRSGLEFSIIQKNNVNFLHGDTFRNGLLLGIKVPF